MKSEILPKKEFLVQTYKEMNGGVFCLNIDIKMRIQMLLGTNDHVPLKKR